MSTAQSDLPGDGHTAVLLYQMGKVGSTSVHASLEAANLGVPLNKVHSLSDEGMAAASSFFESLPVPMAAPRIEESRKVRALMQARPDLSWKVISLVREPIAYSISAFLQPLNYTHPRLLDSPTPNVERIRRALVAHILSSSGGSEYMSRWFDTELRVTFDFDVFESTFPTERGYVEMRRGRHSFLILRLEDLDRCFSDAVSNFLGLSHPVPLLSRSSRSDEKLETAYKLPVYRQIVDKVVIPAEVCRRIYEGRFASQFYSEAEREAFVRRWSDGARASSSVESGRE